MYRTLLWQIVDDHFQGAGTPRKNVGMSSCICMTDSDEPRTVESGLLVLNETEYSFDDFMVRNTPYFLESAPRSTRDIQIYNLGVRMMQIPLKNLAARC